MRGHFGDLDRLMELCDHREVQVIEDCAHTLGATWGGRPVGSWGQIACYSSQTFKHINSGEGGILATDDDAIAAKVIVMSGSYMMYAQQGTRPPLEAFEAARDETPNFSMRMTNVAAALLRPQLSLLEGWIKQWNESYANLERGFASIPHIRPIVRDPRERFVGSSIQFLVEELPPEAIEAFVDDAARHGVFLKWFGAERTAGFTSRYDQWAYAETEDRAAVADRTLARLIDMRIALGFDRADCRTIVDVLSESMAVALKQRGGR